jgi:hypothetical protein
MKNLWLGVVVAGARPCRAMRSLRLPPALRLPSRRAGAAMGTGTSFPMTR